MEGKVATLPFVHRGGPFLTSDESPWRVPVQSANPGWNSQHWDWDPTMFIARPNPNSNLNPSLPNPREELQLVSGNASQAGADQKRKIDQCANKQFLEDVGRSLTLRVGGDFAEDNRNGNGNGNSNGNVNSNMSRQNKRVRSGSPGSNYPMCQVDDCRADLTTAKDYHRRHKVCETHSKAGQALVAKILQRFCQQCSRFHPLQEFDEGKRSCRRRLAGHNRRRRKTQPEDALTRGLLAATQDSNVLGNIDIVSLISILTRLQGNSIEKSTGQPPQEKDQLLQLLSKLNTLINSQKTGLQSPTQSLASQGLDLNVNHNLQPPAIETPRPNSNQLPTLTAELLTILSALTSTSPDVVALLRNLTANLITNTKPQTQSLPVAVSQKPQEHTLQGQKPNFIFSSGINSKTDAPPPQRLPFQFLSKGYDGYISDKTFGQKSTSSGTTSPTEDVSPSSSPAVVQKFFPLHSGDESRENECFSVSKEDSLMLETSPSDGRCSPLNFRKYANTVLPSTQTTKSLYQTPLTRSPQQLTGYTSSSSGSDQSPASSNSDSQERTVRIVFKLFGKDPSHFPANLRTQIYEWLQNSPSAMESYIRPGCVVLTVYVSVSLSSWDQFLENLPQRLKLLIEDSPSDFWRNDRVLLYVDNHFISAKDGKIRPISTLRTSNAPELHYVRPLAVVAGKQTTITVRGRNLANPGTRILCGYNGKYTWNDVLSTSGSVFADQNTQCFTFTAGMSDGIGRCFIEVENGFKGNAFPVIVADSAICKDLQTLELDLENTFHSENSLREVDSQDYNDNYGQQMIREELLQFLNELGWLFQRKRGKLSDEDYQKQSFVFEFSKDRYKFLFIFAVEHDMCALVKMLLDIYFDKDSSIEVAAQALLEINLLHRAVKRSCKMMVQLLLNYTIARPSSSLPRNFIFSPIMSGPGGLTPLHLAACSQDKEDIVDVLTNDPQGIALKSWSEVLDSSGQTPYAYASRRNNHSYNKLVERKRTDKENAQVSISICDSESSIADVLTRNDSLVGAQKALSVVSANRLPQSCAQCTIMNGNARRRAFGRQGMLYRPYVHSMLAIAAVCVCVCLLLRGAPEIGSVAPFKWEKLDFGPK